MRSRLAVWILCALFLTSCQPRQVETAPSEKTERVAPASEPPKHESEPTAKEPEKRPQLSVENPSLQLAMEDGISGRKAVFYVVNTGEIPAKRALVSISVEDKTGTMIELTGEGHSCYFFGLESGGRSRQEYLLPEWLASLPMESKVTVALLSVE